MSDQKPAAERPRPQYGEYATPEQQAAAKGMPLVHTPVPSPAGPLHPMAPPPDGASRLEQRPRRWDLFLSVLLLAYGLYGVISQLVAPVDIAALIKKYYEAQGIGAFTPTALTGELGTVITIAYVVIYVIVLPLTYLLLRRGRIAFWVPLLGGVVATLVASGCAVALMFADPAFNVYLSTLGS